MSDININITADEEPKVHMNIMETVPVGKYEEKANKKQGMEEVTDFEAQFLSAGAIQKVLETKEDVSNKTLGGNYPITHPDCTIAKDKYYASLKYLKECFEYFRGEIGGSGGLVDLSNYFTKDETTRMIDFAIQNVYGAIGSEIKLIDENKEDVSNKVSVIDGLSPDKDKEYPTVWAVWNAVTDCENSAISYTDNAIGNIESALENIIEKYGLGGDAS